MKRVMIASQQKPNVVTIGKLGPMFLTLSEREQELWVRKDPHNIQHIKDPSESIKKLAVQLDGETISYIKQPSEEIQREAIMENSWAILLIQSPSEEMKLLARLRS